MKGIRDSGAGHGDQSFLSCFLNRPRALQHAEADWSGRPSSLWCRRSTGHEWPRCARRHAERRGSVRSDFEHIEELTSAADPAGKGGGQCPLLNRRGYTCGRAALHFHDQGRAPKRCGRLRRPGVAGSFVELGIGSTLIIVLTRHHLSFCLMSQTSARTFFLTNS